MKLGRPQLRRCSVTYLMAPAQNPQTREDAAQLLAHLYKNGHRTPEQLKTALGPETLQAIFG